MGLFEKFKNTIEPAELKRKKSHLKNLYEIALADGRIDNREFDFLLHVGKNKLYLDGKIINDVVNFPNDISFYIPQSNREKIDQLQDCVSMALVDGDLNDREISICKLIAARLGYRPVVIDMILEEIIKGIANGIAREIAVKKLLNEL